MPSLSPGCAVDGPREEGWTPQEVKEYLLYIITHRTPGSQKSSDTMQFLLGAYVKFQPVGWLG